MTEQPLKQAISKEALRIEEDAEYSTKGHYNAADRWARYHLFLGIPSAALGALASGSAFKGCPVLAGALALAASALAVTLTFLKPSERAELHKAAAGQYHGLRNRARIFREIDLLTAPNLHDAAQHMKQMAAERDELNQNTLGIPRQDFEKARKGIEQGESTYKADTPEDQK